MVATNAVTHDLVPWSNDRLTSPQGSSRKMAYRIVIGNRTHVSDDYSSEFETADGKSPWAIIPTEGGGIPPEKRQSLPIRLIIKSGFENTEFSTFGSSYFTATPAVKAVLEALDPRLEFYPLEEVDLVKRATRKIWLLHTPHRVQVINLEASGAAVEVRQRAADMYEGKLVKYRPTYRVRDYGGLVLDKQAIEGLHLWTGTLNSDVSWFCSEAFKQATEPFARSFDFEFTREE